MQRYLRDKEPMVEPALADTAASAPAPLAAVGLGRRFGPRWVLRGLDFSALVGQCVAILGANGSGKSTLLRCLAGLLRPDTGSVLWFGRPAGEVALRARIGFVGHESGLYAQLSVYENLLFAARMYGLASPAARAERMAAEVGLAAHGHRRVAQLSQGMRQRAALARALVHAPQVLLLDEPFAGLDAQGAAWLAGYVQALRRQGCTVCFSTHEPHRAWQLANRVLALVGGRLEPATRQDAETAEGAAGPRPALVHANHGADPRAAPGCVGAARVA